MQLTANQEKFAQAIALENMSQTDAYRAAYSTENMAIDTIYVKASKLAALDKVRARISELRKEANSPKIMSAQKRKEWLSEIICDPKMDVNAKLKASDQLNRMEGEYIQKVEGSISLAKLEDLL